MPKQLLLKLLFWGGSLFYLAEFFFHFFGLPILEHDEIFLPTHDRYIALYGLTYAVLLFLVSTNIKKYRTLGIVTFVGIVFAMMNAYWIEYIGGYTKFFHTGSLDTNLRIIGWLSVLWLIATCGLFMKESKPMPMMK